MSNTSDSTSSAASSSTEQEPLLTVDDLWPALSPERLAELEAVRERCVKAFSSAPLYQAKAAKDPDYWNTFYLGRVR